MGEVGAGVEALLLEEDWLGAARFLGEVFLAAAFFALRGAFREDFAFIPDFRPEALRAGFRAVFFLLGFAAFLFARFFAKLTPFHRKA